MAHIVFFVFLYIQKNIHTSTMCVNSYDTTFVLRPGSCAEEEESDDGVEFDVWVCPSSVRGCLKDVRGLKVASVSNGPTLPSQPRRDRWCCVQACWILGMVFP